jgi:hypothetical protein
VRPRGGTDQACFISRDDEVRAVPRAELHQQPPDVRLGGGHAHVQVSGDFGVGQAEPDQRQHLALPLGEAAEVMCQAGRCQLAGELPDELPGDARRKQRVAGRDDPDRGQQVTWRRRSGQDD